ncbi:AEC family transporter [Natronoarchaeum rubrum]|uniref:AEC family transporter n=1 Tax=Natronoarchaeum rubrum TaxID=755311 RepID=UPI00211354E1|nr:AEC family transporter [Natronoarchaeum rubrum]
MSLVSNLLTMLVLLGVGIAARSIGVLTPARRELLNALAFYVALPALIFSSTYAQQLDEVLTPALLAGLWTVLVVMVATGWIVHRSARSASARSVAIVQSYHGNLGFFGLPIVAATFGDVTTAKASILLGMGALTQVPLTILILVMLNERDASLADELTQFARNPVILSLAAGLAVAVTDVPVPDVTVAGTDVLSQFVLPTALAGLDALSQLALPIAVICVGGALSLESADVELSTVGSVVALKVFLMPAVALAAFSLLASSPSTVRAGVVMLAMPSAVSTYVYATEYGGDERLASVDVFATTVVSLVTIFVLLRFVIGMG